MVLTPDAVRQAEKGGGKRGGIFPPPDFGGGGSGDGDAPPDLSIILGN